jgi:predicted nucleic acid-binding protein
MTVFYLETSALLTWLFDEPDASIIIDTINGADLIVTSDLLKIETMRAIKRALHEKLITSKQLKALFRTFRNYLKSCFVMNMDESVINGATGDFPVEPVRSLDAIHLSTALEYKKLYPELRMLTTDTRLKQNTTSLDLG